ncbi:hypothetical protein ABZX51_000378 [Aspergillus tubingensis]
MHISSTRHHFFSLYRTPGVLVLLKDKRKQDPTWPSFGISFALSLDLSIQGSRRPIFSFENPKYSIPECRNDMSTLRLRIIAIKSAERILNDSPQPDESIHQPGLSWLSELYPGGTLSPQEPIFRVIKSRRTLQRFGV